MKKSFPILYLCSSLGMFGGENVLISLGKEMRQSEFVPVIGVLRNSQNPHTEIANVAANNQIDHAIFPCSGRLDFKTIFLIRNYVLHHGIKIIHTHDFKSDFYGYFVSTLNRIPIMATCHNWISSDRKVSIYNHIDQFLLKYFDNVVAVSPSVNSILLGKHVSPEKIKIIPNGICLDSYNNCNKRYENDLRREFRIPIDCRIVGAVGRLSPEKGFTNLLRAATDVLKEYPSTYFMIVGDGPQKGELYDLASAVGIRENVVFTGIRNDMPEIYSLFDIFVIASFTEGLPMVLLEAMASHVPVIATKVGAIPQVLDHGVSGLLVEPGNIERLQEAMKLLLRNKEQAKSFARKAYERVSANFSSKVMANQYLDVYRRLLN